MLATGKIEKYERLGMDTPKGMVIDTEGKERTDTAQVPTDTVPTCRSYTLHIRSTGATYAVLYGMLCLFIRRSWWTW